MGKLVRDRIPEIIKRNGESAAMHIADYDEYWEKLIEKLSEEVEEYRKSEKVEELADILEVIDAICEFQDINKEKLILLKKKKADERGGFRSKIILDSIK